MRILTTATLMGALCLFAACNEAPQTDPVVKQVYSGSHAQGRALLYDGKTRYELPKASELLEQVVTDAPDNLTARLDLAYAFARRSKFDEASEQITLLNQSLEKLTDGQKLWVAALDAWAGDDPTGTAQAFTAVVEHDPNDRWAWYQLASSHSWAGDYAKSADAAAQAAKVEPDPAKWEASWLYYLHSKALYRSGDYDPAIAIASQGEANATTWRSTFYRRALAQVKAGTADAGALMEEYIDISNAEGRNNPPYTDANIALFYFELGDYQSAADYARKAWAVEQNSYFYWTLLYSLTESNQLADAKALMEEAAGAYSDNALARASEGWALYRLGDLAGADQAVEEAEGLAKRWQIQIAYNKAAIKRAIANPEAAQAPPIPWLG